MTTFQELASIDGQIAPAGEAMVPLKDDGLYRGDGAFEVIRLYGGRPFALATTSTGWNARRRRSSSSSTGPHWSARSAPCSPRPAMATGSCG